MIRATGARARGWARPVVAGTLLTALLAGCSTGGGGSGGSATSGAADGAEGSGTAAASRLDTGARASGGKAAGVTSAGLLDLSAGRELVRTAQVSVSTKDVGSAVDQAEALAVSAGGLVADESITESGTSGPHSATVTLRVPPQRFAGMLEDLAALGKVVSRSQQSQDVTGEVVDVRSRLVSQRSALARLRALLGRAQSLGDVVKLESELSRREADLESLQARQRVLAGQTRLATVEARFSAPPAATPVRRAHLGFLAGLRAGWEAFTGAFAVALTVLGALVPWAVLAGLAAMVLLPAARRVRRTRRLAPPTT